MITAIIAGIFVVSVWVYFKYREIKAIHLPRNQVLNRPVSNKSYFNLDYEFPQSCRLLPNKTRYHKKRVPKNIDVIVIGSGIGGLSSAAFLAKQGNRVLVLEQHDVAGGSTHCYLDMGVEFDTGIHYVGNISNRKKVLDLITKTPIEWDQLGREDGRYVYDKIYIDGDKYEFRAGKENFVKDLSEHFPNERENIEKYVEYVEKVSKKDMFFNLKIAKPVWLVNLLSKYLCKEFYETVNRSAYDVISDFTDNERLKAVLCGQFGDSGPTPKNNPFFMHASVVHHYLHGGWYPRGGTSEIANKIIPTIEDAGGRVLVNVKVKNILLKNNKVNGVLLDNDQVIYAPKVISAAGAIATAQHLLPDCNYKNKLLNHIKNIGPSCTYVYLFAKFKGTPEELNLHSANIWSWPNEDYDKMLDEWYKDPSTAPVPMFAGFPCTKDSTWNTRFPGHSNAVILTAAKYEWFADWDKQRVRHRGQEYKHLKKVFENRLLEELYKYYPQLKEKLEYANIGTPVTFNHYIGSTFGECYGLDCNPKRFTSDDILRPGTDIEGLYLSGQDVTTLGFTGALMAGVLTAHAVLGYGTLTDIVSGRNLIKDMLDNL